jgi:hypothetical protein
MEAPKQTAGVKTGRLYDPKRSVSKIVSLIRKRIERAIEAGELAEMEFELKHTKRVEHFREVAFLDFEASSFQGLGGGEPLIDAASGELSAEATAALDAVYRLAQASSPRPP